MTSKGLLGYVGLGVAAGSVVVGTGSVRRGLQRDGLCLVLVARDYSERTGDKVVRLAKGRGVTVLIGPPSSELGRPVGRQTVQAIGITDPALAQGMLEASGAEVLEED